MEGLGGTPSNILNKHRGQPTVCGLPGWGLGEGLKPPNSKVTAYHERLYRDTVFATYTAKIPKFICNSRKRELE